MLNGHSMDIISAWHCTLHSRIECVRKPHIPILLLQKSSIEEKTILSAIASSLLEVIQATGSLSPIFIDN